MRCSYRASIAEPVEAVWAALSDPDRVLPALPGATLARDGEGVVGSVKCAVGGAQITYRITVASTAADAGPRAGVLSIDGREARGSGTVRATLTVAATAADAGTGVEVDGEIEVTGRGASADPADWSRVLGRLLNGVLATVVGAHVSGAERATSGGPETAATPPRPALSIAPDGRDYAPDDLGWADRLPSARVVGTIVFGLVFIVRRRRRRHRSEGADE